ncbi:Endonuclease domain-containing 1 protein [Anabarilius grahami]|uniref:Endonuclease domain-containing 1 protein n=1 Tax=Anabarilius grahami TaxID=495550 RepID=A0A3N0XRZ7_ANAGA|nr:Endonuclease domain-containing 1 protein [Anabarilius grahami]
MTNMTPCALVDLTDTRTQRPLHASTSSLTLTVYLISCASAVSQTQDQLHTMFVLGLLTCIVLRAFSAQAKVVDTFGECSRFFYKDTEPGGMNQNAEKICQKLDNRGFYYATLYFNPYKIPLYSAYILDPACSSDTSRSNIWHLEPKVYYELKTKDFH